MTIEIIIAQLERISADSEYDIINNNRIDLIIDDFDGYDDDWGEQERELINGDLVDEVLDWLEKNADCVDGDFYTYYHFGEIVVELSYSSFDI
jgi:hypothetical protein